MKRQDESILVVLVLHNSAEHLERVLPPICSNREVVRIVLFDNASEDRSRLLEVTRPFLAEFGDRVILHISDENLGYGRAINRAFDVWGSESSKILFANPDISLTSGTIENLTNCLNARDRLGAIAPVTVRIDEIPYQRCWTTPASSLRNFIPPWPANALRLPVRQQQHQPREDDIGLWLEGSIILMRSDAFRAVGGFDENFFLYAEDEDLCKRLVKEGWTLSLVDLGIEVEHSRGASQAGKFPTVAAHYHSSIYGFLYKWYGRRAAEIYKVMFRAWLMIRRLRGRTYPDKALAVTHMDGFASRQNLTLE